MQHLGGGHEVGRRGPREPNALPLVMGGLDVAMIFALIGAIVAEFVGAQRGLGMLIQSTKEGVGS